MVAEPLRSGCSGTRVAVPRRRAATGGSPALRRRSIQATPTAATTAASAHTISVAPSPNIFSADASSTNASARRIRPPRRPRGDAARRCRRRGSSRPAAAAVSQLEVAEQDVAERRRRDQRYGLHQVGADELVRLQRGVQRQQRDDDQRAGADRGHADDETADDADQDRGHRATRRPWAPPARGSRARRVRRSDRRGARSTSARYARTARPAAAISSATPRPFWMTFCDPAPSPSAWRRARRRTPRAPSRRRASRPAAG